MSTDRESLREFTDPDREQRDRDIDSLGQEIIPEYPEMEPGVRLDEPLPAPLGQRARWLLAKPLLRLGWWIGR